MSLFIYFGGEHTHLGEQRYCIHKVERECCVVVVFVERVVGVRALYVV